MSSTKNNHNQIITDSWKRSESHGLTHETKPTAECLKTGELKDVQHEYNFLLGTTSEDVLPHYASMLSNSSCLVMMADQHGHILNCWGDKRKIKGENGQTLHEGANWSEEIRGTNAIGTAIATGQAVQVQRDEHFLKYNRFMMGSAAPIYDTNNKLVAVLDVSSDAYLPQMHTLGMVKMMSQSVENRLIQSKFWTDDFLLTFNTSPDTLDSQWIGLIAFNESGTIISANRRAQMLLRHELALQSVEEIFQCRLFELKNAPEGGVLEVMALGKYKMYVTIQKPARPFTVAPDFRKTHAPKEPHSTEINTQEIYQDQRLQRNFAMAQSILDKNIPVLLNGDTSTGKETFARKLHANSTKAAYPFIQINCSTLEYDKLDRLLFGIDSEEFEHIGAVRQSNKGILFLNEISEFPLSHQSRLLEVLSDGAVTPINGDKSYVVNLTVITSTQCDLKTQVKAGKFRDDLYHHLAGLMIDMPPLHKRTDLEHLITDIYNQQTGTHHPIPQELMNLLVSHPWPGNLKQLKYTLAVACAMAQSSALAPWHLPDSFFNEITPPEPNKTVSEAPSEAAQAPEPTSDRSAQDEVLHQYKINKGNISRTAKALGISRNTLYKRLKELGVKT